MSFTPRLQALLDALRCLPGVGPKSAQRMAFHLLDKDRDGAAMLVRALRAALDEVGSASAAACSPRRAVPDLRRREA